MEFKKRNNPRQSGPKPVPSLSAQSPAPIHEQTKDTSTTPLKKPPHFLLAKRIIGISIAIVIVLVSYFIIQSNTGASDPNKIVLDPGYQTILPTDKSIKELGGWKRISPPEKEPVYAYTDKIDDITISVSQQPLPASFSTNTKEQVAELAKKFNATTELDASGTTVYIGTSAKGPQSIIFVKKKVLILIKSQQKISTTSWQKYAESLSGYQY